MQQEDLTRAGVRRLSQAEQAYYRHIGLQPELTRQLAQEDDGELLLSTDLGLLLVKPKETRPNIVVIRINGHAPKTDEEQFLIAQILDDYRKREPVP